MKLYNDNEVVKIPTKVEETKETVDTTDEDFEQLDETMLAYESLSNVYSSISDNAFSFVDKKNHVLYNEYIASITRNLGLKSTPTVSVEALEELPGLIVNQSLALEGFLGTLWDKMKAVFKKLFDAISEFGKKYFTRLGRLKNKLENLKKVLSETDKDIKQVNLDKVPGGISKSFPVKGDVSEATVSNALKVTEDIISILTVANKDAIKLAGKDVLNKDFVATVKGLKAQIAKNGAQIDANNQDKVSGLKGLVGDGRQTNNDIKAANKDLANDSSNKTNEVNKAEGQVKELAGKELEDDAAFEAVKREMAAYYKELAEKFKAITNKPIPGGKVITEVKIDDDGIELVTEENKETPDTVSLGDRNSLLSMVDASLSSLDAMGKATENFSKVNDAIMKNVDTVDSLIKDLDKVSDNKDYAAYRKVLDKQVKERLKIMQQFFKNYNKVNKSLIEAVSSVGDGVVAYSVASLKYFG